MVAIGSLLRSRVGRERLSVVPERQSPDDAGQAVGDNDHRAGVGVALAMVPLTEANAGGTKDAYR